LLQGKAWEVYLPDAHLVGEGTIAFARWTKIEVTARALNHDFIFAVSRQMRKERRLKEELKSRQMAAYVH
jgi:hypothetical protein